MSASNTPRFVFINQSTNKKESSPRHRELQAAVARAHAARVSSRKARAVKRGTTSKPTSRLPPTFDLPTVLALRPAHGTLSRRTKVIQDEDDDGDIYFHKRRFYSPSISRLGQGEGDPFDSAPVKGLNNFIYSILDFAYDYVFPSFAPAPPASLLPSYRATRRQAGWQYEYLLEAQIAAAAKHHSSPLASLTEDVRRQIKLVHRVHEKRAMELITQELQHNTAAPPDLLIYALALLTYSAGPNYSSTSTKHQQSPLARAQSLHAMGHTEFVPERAQAIRTLIQVRGGIDELQFPYMGIVLTYADIIVSTRLGVRPGWKWPATVPESLHSGEHVLDQGAFELLQIMGSGFNQVQHQGMRQALLMMCQLTVALDHCHRGGPTAPAIWNIARMRLALQHRFCSFDPIMPDQNSYSDIQFELCRLSGLIFSDLVLFPIPEPASIKPRLLYDLGRALDKCDVNHNQPPVQSGSEASHWRQSANQDFLAWCILLAAAASTHDTVFRSRYIGRLERLIRLDNKLRSWDFYKGLVTRYIWWDYVLDSLALEAFNAVPWKEI